VIDHDEAWRRNEDLQGRHRLEVHVEAVKGGRQLQGVPRRRLPYRLTGHGRRRSGAFAGQQNAVNLSGPAQRRFAEICCFSGRL
jgi:hypothetical protein